MAAGTAVRNRSEIVTVVTPRGPVEVLRQEMRGLREGSSWTWFWVARRKGRGDWAEAATVREAIRKATLLAPGKPPAWLREAVAQAEHQILGDQRRDRTAKCAHQHHSFNTDRKSASQLGDHSAQSDEQQRSCDPD